MEDSKKEYSTIEIEIAEKLLEKGFEWIARDENDALYAFKTKPRKGGDAWNYGGGVLLLMDENARGVIPIFDGIRWEDEEPIRIRDIVPKILTDEEGEWLRTVVRAFPGKLKTVEVHNGAFYGRYVTFTSAYPTEWGGSSYVGKMRLLVTEDWFEGMEKCKDYTPEELGL